MRRVSILLLSVLAISLFVSFSFAQSASASCFKHRPFWFAVNLHPGPDYGYTSSNLRWMRGFNVHPIGPWIPGDPMVVEDYMDGIFYCHGDWCMICELEGYDGVFRYNWWIFWDTSPYVDPSAECVGGYFTFGEGTGGFSEMEASGKAWVTWHLEDSHKALDYQIHFGLLTEAPK